MIVEGLVKFGYSLDRKYEENREVYVYFKVISWGIEELEDIIECNR